MYKVLIIVLLLAVPPVFAQQLPFVRTEIYSPQWYNPASYGTWNTFSANLLGATPLSQIDETYYLMAASAEGHVGFRNSNMSVGIGAYGLLENRGFYRMDGANLALNLQYDFSRWTLSAGLSSGVRTIDFSNAVWNPPTNVADPNLPTGIQSAFMMDAGVYAYNDKFFLGLACAQLNAPVFSHIHFSSARHYVLDAGYRFKVSPGIQLFPSLSLMTDGAVTIISSKILIQFAKPAFSIGLGYTYPKTITCFAGYEFKRFSCLYGATFHSEALVNSFVLSNELRLTYKIRRKQKCATCEYF